MRLLMAAPPPISRRRVVVTGLGAVTCVGLGAEALWIAAREGRGGIGRLTRFDASDCRARCAGEVRDFDPASVFQPKRLRRTDRHTQLAVAAAKMAMEDAGLTFKEGKRHDRRGVVLGTALAGISDAEGDHARFAEGGARAVNPMLALMIFGGAGSSNISIELGLGGPCAASSNSCASGNLALGEAARMVRDGTADVMLAGGSEAPLCPLTFSAFDLIHTMSRIADPARACCPFSAGRDGFVMAEGSAILVLEAEEHARQRGARVYAEFLGAASNSDAWHMAASLPSGEQAAACMLAALADAGAAPASVDYVNAHASSTPINDRNETVALKRAFGEHARRLAISGTKPIHGHALGAVAAMEAVICARAIHEGFIPPTANLDAPDPECDLDYVPLKGRPFPLGVVLSNAFGFGGVNASIVLGRYP